MATAVPAPPAAPRPFIRRYAPEDRTAVRSLCCETADSGKPVERFFSDREVFADLVTRYYTDVEPGSSWILEERGRVIGYLNGCRDTRRFARIMAIRILPRLLLKSVRRGTWLQSRARRFVALNAPLWWRPQPENRRDYHTYPAHFHVNLAANGRARGTGTAMVAMFLSDLQGENIPGVHVNVREDNLRARAFFKKLGFSPISRHPVLCRPDQPDHVFHSIRYGKRL